MNLKVHIGNIGETFNVSQIIGKNLTATVNVNVRSTPDISLKTNILYVAKAGEMVGNVYSWVYGKDKDASKIYWMLDKDSSHGYRFVLHNANAFHFGTLKDQGAKTVKEETKAKEEQAKQASSGFSWSNLPDLAKKAVYVVGGFLAIKLLIDISKK